MLSPIFYWHAGDYRRNRCGTKNCLLFGVRTRFWHVRVCVLENQERMDMMTRWNCIGYGSATDVRREKRDDGDATRLGYTSTTRRAREIRSVDRINIWADVAVLRTDDKCKSRPLPTRSACAKDSGKRLRNMRVYHPDCVCYCET